MKELETGIFDLAKAIKRVPAGVTQVSCLLTESGWTIAFKETKEVKV